MDNAHLPADLRVFRATLRPTSATDKLRITIDSADADAYPEAPFLLTVDHRKPGEARYNARPDLTRTGTSTPALLRALAAEREAAAAERDAAKVEIAAGVSARRAALAALQAQRRLELEERQAAELKELKEEELAGLHGTPPAKIQDYAEELAGEKAKAAAEARAITDAIFDTANARPGGWQEHLAPTQRVAHYIEEGGTFSLCGRLGFYMGTRTAAGLDATLRGDECAACVKKVTKLKEARDKAARDLVSGSPKAEA